MIALTREVRFSLVADALRRTEVGNSWAGWPPPDWLAPFLTLRCTVSGEPETETAYICNIKLIDNLIREHVVELLAQSQPHPATPDSILHAAQQAIAQRLPKHLRFDRLILKPTPYTEFAWLRGNSMEPMPLTTVTEQFEFSASHRLYNPRFDDAKNQELFGKCSHKNGHGHNYLLNVTIVRTADDSTVDLQALERTVKRVVIDRVDHKHLNLDVPPFDKLNPTVERIAWTLFDWLREPIAKSLAGWRLHRVRLYETPKTWADVDAT